MRSSLCSVFRRVSRPRPAARHTVPKCRPRLEALDGRTLLSTSGLHIVAAPTFSDGSGSSLNAVAEIGPNDVWAVGGVTNPSTGQINPLAEHFNGTSWSVVPSPSSPGNFFTGVAGVSSNDVWAVGTGGSSTTPLVEHWNGTQWSIVSTPSLPPSGGGVFSAVTAVASNDVWAVGSANGANLIEHWDGTSWSVVLSPGVRNARLGGVSGTSSNDVWAVGSAGRSTADQVEILHWNGTAWSVLSAPSPGSEPFLSSVVALAPNNAWAVGATILPINSSESSYQTLIEHWDGTSWSVVPSPNAGSAPTFNEVRGVAAVSANNIWAVGLFLDPNTNVYRTLTEHWDGTSWSVIPSPNVTSTDSDSLSGVTANSNGDVVAVGVAPLSNGQGNGLILANNEPAGSTPVGPPPPPPSPPSPGPGITD